MPIRTFACINIATRIITAQRESQGRKLNLLEDAVEIGLVATLIANGIEQDEREQREEAERKAAKNVVPIWSKT